LRDRADEIKKFALRPDHRPRVACIEWIDPLMAAGNWVPQLVHMAGGENLFGCEGEHSPWLDWEAFKNAEPDLILIFPCGFDIRRTRSEVPVLEGRPGWRSLQAVKNGQVYLMDGNRYFNRPGPGLGESLEILAEIMHPQVFKFGHEGAGWERL
jgi:iron complex transport system substrate-binding protein